MQRKNFILKKISAKNDKNYLFLNIFIIFFDFI